MVRPARRTQIGPMDTTAPSGPDESPAAPPPREPAPGPRVTRDEVRDLGRLRRSVNDRHIAGVAGGLARHLDIDPVIVRVGLVVLAFFGGAGVLAYLALWLLVPEEGTDSEPLGLDARNRGIALVGAGVVIALAAVGEWFGAFWVPWPLIVVGLVAWLFVSRARAPKEVYVPPGADGAPATSYSPGATVPRAYPPAPRRPRKPGIILFWPALGLIGLALATLTFLVGAAGVSVEPSTFPAVALAITGALLVLGAFWGRGGGLIALGLAAAIATAGLAVIDDWQGEALHYRPAATSHVQESYELRQGELVLDLSDLRDPQRLDGRTLAVDGQVGRIEVIVPAGVEVAVDASISGPGGITVGPQEVGGFDTHLTETIDGGADAPRLAIDADLAVGAIVVRQQ